VWVVWDGLRPYPDLIDMVGGAPRLGALVDDRIQRRDSLARIASQRSAQTLSSAGPPPVTKIPAIDDTTAPASLAYSLVGGVAGHWRAVSTNRCSW
jgi:hypothetical protein